MLKLKDRMNYVLNGDDGASNVEIIIWFAVVFFISVALFALRDAINNFIKSITTKVGTFKTEPS